MTLVDTSAWAEFDRASGSEVDRRLTELIRNGDHLFVTEPVLMEVLAAARDDVRSEDVRRLLTSFAWLPADPVADLEGAAQLYRRCQEHGVTPDGLVDCMIVNIALRTGARILAADGAFDAMARILPLQLDGAAGS